MFTNCLLEALRNCTHEFVKINGDVKQDIAWFMEFLPKFNGKAQYVHVLPSQAHTFAIDASLERVGGVWANQVYSISLPPNLKTGRHSITHFEIINILVALKLWAREWQQKHINLYVDNQAVVTICNTGYTRDTELATYLRNIWLITSIWDINLVVHHIPGYKNKIADCLSRWQGTEQCCQKLSSLVPQAEWCQLTHDVFEVNYDI